MYHLLLVDEFGAAEALRIGLVQEVVPVGKQVERAMELVVERGLPPRTGPKDPGVRSATSDGTEAGPDRKATR